MANPNLDEVTERRRRTMLIGGVLTVVAVLVAVGVALAVLANHPSTPKPPITPAEETSETPSNSLPSSSSVSATSSTVSTSSASTITSSTATSTTPPGQIVRSGRIAYRLGGQIWVSSEDGSGAKAVFTSANGAYALSPDGATLVVQSGTTFVLVTVSDGVQIPLVGPVDLPSWSPDSSWLAYTGSTKSGASVVYTVRRVNRDGTGDSLVLTNGAEPQVAPDGTRVAFTKSIDPGPTDALQVYDTSSKVLRKVPGADGAQSYAWAPGGVLYFAKDRNGAVAGWLGMVDKTLAKNSVIASLPLGDPPVSPGALFPSPDGAKVLFALIGDDGYSRLQIADASAKKITAVHTVYDAYPKGWLLDGSAVLYIDGNAIQNEATSLYRIRPDGSGRVKVVSGAGL